MDRRRGIGGSRSLPSGARGIVALVELCDLSAEHFERRDVVIPFVEDGAGTDSLDHPRHEVRDLFRDVGPMGVDDETVKPVDPLAAGDVQGGALGDRWFLGALATAAHDRCCVCAGARHTTQVELRTAAQLQRLLPSRGRMCAVPCRL